MCELPGKEAYLQMILAGTPIGQSLAEESKEVREEIRGETHDTLVRWTVNGRLALPAQCVPVTARRYGRRTRSAPGSPPERKANVQDIRAGAALVHAAEYALDLDVDHPGETFRGHLVVKVEETRSPLELDAVELTVDSVKVEGGSTEFRWDQSGQKLIIPLSGSGTNQVEIDYHGRARRDVLNGFYVSSFGSGTLLTTMMQPVGC
ncbi:MAG TPA: hypothetical protein VFG07_04810, partial [Thermoplasmata archaeon]|nr:hypothetical protein [Thermoplasmata archaeon]